MTEVRTTSATGGQKGVKPERYDLLPKESLDAMARVYAFGAEKYADHNWRKGYEWSKSFAAAMRHMWAFWNGETFDEESGLPHLAHAAFHLNAMLTWLERDGEGGQFDDRWINSPALQGVTQEDIDAVAATFTEKYVPPTTPPAPSPEYAELAERGVRIAQNAQKMAEGWVHPDEKTMAVLSQAAESPTVQRSYRRRQQETQDILDLSAMQAEIEEGQPSMPSETAKKLGIDGDFVQQNIQMHSNGGPAEATVAQEIRQAIEARAARRLSH